MSVRLPEATVARLPLYLQAAVAASRSGRGTIGSIELAAAAGVKPANVRKDLSAIGTFGTRGVGYRVPELVDGISGVLGLTRTRAVAIVGVGNLGRALANYAGFAERGFRVAALVDADPALVGEEVAGHVVAHVDDLGRLVGTRGVDIGVVATPAPAAQPATDALVAAGVTAILNFAPARLRVPEDVEVREVDLSTELQILSFYQQLRTS